MQTREQKANILPRLLKLSDFSPFVLVLDTLAQSAETFLPEFRHYLPPEITKVNVFLEHHAGHKRISPEELIPYVKGQISGRTVVFIDNLGLLKDVGSVLHQIMGPEITIVGVFHRDLDPPPNYNPTGSQLLKYMATSIIELLPSDQVDTDLIENPWFGPFDFKRFNSPIYSLNVIHRRKSGREITASFLVDCKSHSIEYLSKKTVANEQEALLTNLSTFNLTTTDKQRLEREKVELPYLHAQELGDGGAQGGAIVYHFEKEDDYDEEDPYEDPF